MMSGNTTVPLYLLNTACTTMTLIILWVSGIITQQEKGSTTSIQSIDTHLSHVTTRLPASTEDPGMSLKTGNIFITHSSDLSSEIVPFVDFLSKQGFRPAIDIFDNPIRRMDINKWKDSYLKDPATLIIVAISPMYKADIEGSVVDNHGLHTRYIHSMMQNEYIQQGSLNFRFIPVLFLNASQKYVPSWLQNTRVYSWPRDTEDLLLRLLREERYIPPPVPMEPTLIIRPVASSSAATQ
ncbi:Adapter protein CIKS [Collichthys lucidus]|uniref:Adapter protein CIKS n=1 Tax=Collichthys lucidus TaxID=240159 RepID=A0A4U5VFG2_COLLU|nr:Adapter protein CIKS [Collichthys lucidus]